MSKPRTFQELATKAHDIEMTIANHRGKSPSSYEIKKDKGDQEEYQAFQGVNEGNHGHFHRGACTNFKKT